MSTTEQVSPIISGRQKQPFSMVLYGVEGVGKTSAGADAPNPIFIAAEDGASQLAVDRFPQCFEYGDVKRWLAWLWENEHDYKTLVIDSADWIQELIIKQVISDANVKSLEDIPYGKGWIKTAEMFFQFLNDLTIFKREKGMNVVILAHCEIRKFHDPVGDTYDYYAIACNDKHVTPKLKQWGDCVLFADFDKTTKEVGEGFQKRTVAKSWGQRILFTEHRATHDAKNRYNLPERLPMPKESPLGPFMEGYNAFYGE